ncbi:MAG TPA: hypothetical protein VMJ10_11195 [Kofleriaceae bacterium]|nr:hypothetical protein [Kofleriaceae bacterium]
MKRTHLFSTLCVAPKPFRKETVDTTWSRKGRAVEGIRAIAGGFCAYSAGSSVHPDSADDTRCYTRDAGSASGSHRQLNKNYELSFTLVRTTPPAR